MGMDKSEQPERHFAIEQELEAKIVKIDPGERKISLSLSALANDEERQQINSYMQRQGSGGVVSLGEMMQDKQIDTDTILSGTSEEKEPEEAEPEA